MLFMNKHFIAVCTCLCTVFICAAQNELRTDTLQEVVVTGTGTQHLLQNAPVQTEVITSRMLRQYSGRSIEDLNIWNR